MISYKNIILGLTAASLFTGCGVGGDDEGGVSGSHNQGKDCKACHSNFTASGTVFTTLDAADGDVALAATNYTLKMLLENNNSIVFAKGNGSGNARTTASIANLSFTAQVLDPNNKVVQQSMRNSHNSSKLNCNSCHTQSGSNGAPGRITNFNF